MVGWFKTTPLDPLLPKHKMKVIGSAWPTLPDTPLVLITPSFQQTSPTLRNRRKRRRNREEKLPDKNIKVEINW